MYYNCTTRKKDANNLIKVLRKSNICCTFVMPKNNKQVNIMATILAHINKTTDKAINFTASVRWSANNKPVERSFWAPKSVCEILDGERLDIAQWFVNKLEDENAFKGYKMRFDDLFGQIIA